MVVSACRFPRSPPDRLLEQGQNVDPRLHGLLARALRSAIALQGHNALSIRASEGRAQRAGHSP
eukprot:7007379-Prymnesium_polylepis.1